MTQREKNLVSLLVTALVACGLALYAWFGVMKPEEAETERKAVSEKLFAAQAPGERSTDGGEPPAPVFTRLEVKAQGDTTVLERKDGAWRIVSPVDAPADKFAVDSLTQQLQGAKFKHTVVETPSDEELEKFGLKTPVFTVSAKAYVPDAQGGGENDASRQKSVTLYGGIENTFDGSVYLRREGEAAVYAVDGSVRFSLERSTFDLREKEVLGVDLATVQRLEVKAPANAWVLERDAQKLWRLIQPVADMANETKVDSLVSGLRAQRALAFPADSAEARAKLGLEKPAVDARFTLASGEPIRVRISRVEEKKAEGDTPASVRAYALREQGPQALLVEVPEEALRALDVPVNDLKDKRALRFRRDDVHQVTFYPGGKEAPFTLAKTGEAKAGTAEAWQVTAPTQGRAKIFKLLSLLSTLDTLKAAELSESKPKAWEKYGINDASRGAELRNKDGQVLARLWLGTEVKGKEGRLWARGSRDEVLEVESTALSELPKSVDDLLDVPPPPATDAGTPDAGTSDAGTP